MATAERRTPTRSGSLSNEEAAALIQIILDNTNTSSRPGPVIPDSPKSLEDLFPTLVGAE